MNLPLGYRYASAYAGIRKQESDDVALIVPTVTANAAALFTRNMVKAAPVKVAARHLKSSRGKVSAILVNAGNANCATRTGDKVALASCRALGRALHARTEQVLPSSTGVIGVELDPLLLTGAVPALIEGLSPDKFEQVAKAIMTTDTRMKVACEEVTFRGGTVRIAGMTKGAGMIHPNMATTLAFVMTDAEISPRNLHAMLVGANERSFSSLTVDGDMSTNDTLALLANGVARVRPNEKERKVFGEVLSWVLENLAEQIAADGEGARKLILVHAVGFKTNEDAKTIARAIANSPLVKTAMGGSDPNWGRIICAAGYSGVKFDPLEVDIFLQQQLVCKKGLAAPFDESALKAKLNEAEICIKIANRAKGHGEARMFTCDLTEDYIKINGSYRT